VSFIRVDNIIEERSWDRCCRNIHAAKSNLKGGKDEVWTRKDMPVVGISGSDARGGLRAALGDFVSELLGLLRSCLCPISDSLSLF
jgi:hypothetical protein